MADQEVEKVEVETLPEDAKVEVVDDTPEEDRGRKPLPKEMVEELDKDDLDEYSEKVKKRLSQMKKVWHDERREKERATREREEALAFAQRIHEENRQLKQRLGRGEKVLFAEVTKAATNELSTAKDALKRAYESGDADQITNAQEALTEAKLKLNEYQKFKPALQDKESSVEVPPQQVQSVPQVQVDPKAEAWRQNNTWFGADDEMTALALGLHEKLVKSGVDPRNDDYYRQIDMTMRKRFPERFEDDATQSEEREEKPVPRKTTVVAPVTRSTAPRQIRLTSTEAAIAKRLGLTPEAYAREKIKLENYNG